MNQYCSESGERKSVTPARLHSFIQSLDFKVLGPTMTIGPVV